MLSKIGTALSLLILLAGCDPVTPAANINSTQFEGFAVFSVIPENPVGIVYLFHGTGGSANVALKIEPIDQTNELLERGYGWIATESTQRTGNKRWDVFDASITSNPDLARLERLHAHVVANTAVSSTTPIFGIGMSNGARMVTLFGQVFADNGYPVGAVAPFMGKAAPFVQASGGLRVPGFWVNATNDALVDPALVVADQQASAALGIPAVLFTKLEEPMLPFRFTRIPAVDPTEAVAIWETLIATQVWDAQGNRVTDVETMVAALEGISAPPGTGALPTQIGDQIGAMLAFHEFTSAFRIYLADFFDEQRIAMQAD
ncbi:MAG: hypothetical protein AB8C02_07935 [Halioglobus sp.]